MFKKNSRVLSVLLSLVLVFGTMCVPAFATDAAAVNDAVVASEATTYTISSADDLIALQNAVNSQTTTGTATNPTLLNCNVVLTQDIDMTGKTWSGMGVPQQFKGFTGTFDGQGHTIRGISITNTSNVGPKGGLFNLTSNATIKNLTVTGSVTSNRFIGGLVGRVIGNLTVENCNVNMDLTLNNGQSNSIGGLVGQCGSGSGGGTGGGNGGTASTVGEVYVSGCTVSGTFISNTSTNPVGGMFGHIYTGYYVEISDSDVTASLTCTGGTVASFVANNASALTDTTGVYFDNCRYATGISTIMGGSVTSFGGETPIAFTPAA